MNYLNSECVWILGCYAVDLACAADPILTYLTLLNEGMQGSGVTNMRNEPS